MNVKELRMAAPAKLNLTLRVAGKRPDGVHEIESWVVKIGWGDELVVRAAERLVLKVEIEAPEGRRGEAGETTGVGTGGDVPPGESNLVWRAALALASAAGISVEGAQRGEAATKTEPARVEPAQKNSRRRRRNEAIVVPPEGRNARRGASIELLKRIPAGAGLGGGSSDAAATLRALNELWGLDWPLGRLTEVAVAIGSDVPLFLEPGSVVIRGRGERVERLREHWQGWAVVVVPPFGVSTAKVYRRWRPAPAPRYRSTSKKGGGASVPLATRGRDARPTLSPVSAPAGRRRHVSPWTAEATNAATLLRSLFNDLEAPAFECEPRLRDLHARLDGLDERPVRMTGSGSCLFTLFDDAAEAEAWRRAAADRAGEAVLLRVVEVI